MACDLYSMFNSPEELFLYLAGELERYSKLPNKQHISLSGGTTPKAFFNFIVASTFKGTINWSNLNFWWGDERCVEFTDEQSNYGEAKRLLFDHINIPSENIHFLPLDLENSIEDYHVVAEAYACKMKQEMPIENNYPIYDWIILGVGTDGHTASLFPNEYELQETATAICVLKPNTNEFRVTITANTISSAKRVSYLVTGSSKARVIADILLQHNAYESYPAYMIKSKTGKTEYLLDAGAGLFLTANEGNQS